MTAATARIDTTREEAPRRRSTSTLALVLVTAVSPLATDMYPPALPAIQQSLHTSAFAVQATLTTFIVGFAAGQLVTGPISDGRGRRAFTVWGPALFAVASAVCALTPSIGILLAGRLLQGLGGGAGVAAGRAMVTDRSAGTAAAKRLATLFSFLLLGPIVAPVLGGAILTVLDWRGIFALLAVVGAATAVAAAIGLPETLPDTARTRAGLTVHLRRYTDLLSQSVIRRLLLANSLSSAAMFAYLGSASLVYQTQLGVSPRRFSLLFGASAALMTAASIGFRRLLGTRPVPALHLTGATVSTTAAIVLVAVTVTATPPIWIVVVIVTAALAGNGFSAPANTIRFQGIGHRAAATAAAAALSAATAYLAAPLVALPGRPRLLTMAGFMAAFFTLQLLVLLTTRTGPDDPAGSPPGQPAVVTPAD